MLSFILLLMSSISLLANDLPTEFNIQRADGSSLTYYFKRPSSDECFPIIAMLQGSEAASCFQYYDWFLGKELFIDKLKAGFLLVEKPGIHSLNNINIDEYYACNTLTQRIQDYKLVIEQLRKVESYWDRRIIFIGFSEGGMLASLLGALIPESQAIVILSGGCGMTLKDEMLTLIGKESSLSKYSNRLYFHAIMLLAYCFPKSTLTAYGSTNTLKWWADIAEVMPWKYLERVNLPIFLAHGTRDVNCPVESADKLQQYFENKGKTNLTYRRYTGYDHNFNDQQNKNHIDNILAEIAQWLQERNFL